MKNPFFVRYMIRELSSVFFAIYAVILLVGLMRLGQGEAAFAAWLSALASPPSVLFHCIALAFALYHTWTWFKVMPKTMPLIRVGGSKLPNSVITFGGVAASVVVWLIVFVVAAGMK